MLLTGISGMAPGNFGFMASPSTRLGELEVQRERMLHAVTNGGRAVAQEALQFSSAGAGDDEIGLLCLPALKYAGTLEYKAAGFAGNSAHDLLEADERS